MKREIQKYLVASTGHIPLTDKERMEKKEVLSPLVIYEYEFGFNIYVNLDPNEPKVEESEDFDYSEALRNLIRIAREEGCTFLKLDSDGPEYEDLEVFDW